MSFPRYPKYKASGVEWIGEVPEGWAVSCLKHSVKDIYSGGTPETGNPEFWAVDEEDSIPWVAIGDMTRAAVVDRTEKQITRAGLASKRLRVLPKGTLLYSMYASLGKVAVLSEPATINQAILGIIPDSKKLAQNFLRYWLIQIERHLSLFSSSNTQDNLNAGKVRSLPLLVPNGEEQTAIAEFLDRETGKIDELVAEQRRLMELLKEKRQAVISHAVTKGLNPHAPMKPSGIEWLGDVPVGWEVIQIKQASKLESGHTPSRQHPEYWENCTIPWFTLADVWQIRDAKAEYLFDTKEKVSALGLANSSARLLPKNTVILSRTASVGFSGIMAVDMATTQDFANWICGPRLKPEFLLYVLRAMDGEFRRLMMGSTHNTIYMPDIKSLRFGLPPMEQQAEIVEYVREMTSEFDTLTAEAQRTIDLLQERRTALISAAVTGQIDVRQQPRN